MSLMTLVVFVHVVAACVWIGGQITLALLIPVLRGHPDLVTAAGQRFQKVAWTAYGVLILTGIDNVLNLRLGWAGLTGTEAGQRILVKLVFVLISGTAAGVHAFLLGPRQRGRLSRPTFSLWAALFGTVSLSAALVAALYGVVLVRG